MVRQTDKLKKIASARKLETRIEMLDKLFETQRKGRIPQADESLYDANDLKAPTYLKLGFTEEEAILIFLDHRFMSRRLIAEKYGIERLFVENKTKPTNIVQRIYQDIISKPYRYENYITLESIKEIQGITTDRAMTMNYDTTYGVSNSIKAVIAEPVADMAKKLDSIAQKATNALDLKYDTIKHKKDLKNVDIKKLADVMNIVLNNKRLSSGEATQHVAHIIKQDGLDKLDSKDLMEILNVQRQNSQMSKE